MTPLMALEELTNKLGSQAEVAQKLGKDQNTALQENGKIVSKVLEQQILALWKKEVLSNPQKLVSSHGKKKALGIKQPPPATGAKSFIASIVDVVGKTSKSMPLTLYQFKLSPYCAKVRQILERKNLEYTAINVKQGSALAKEIESRLGSFMVPVLEHGNMWLGESDQIIGYLNETFPDDSKPTIKEKVWGNILFSSTGIFRGRKYQK